ncbi:MAG: hypothetical protein KF729_33510 [Sandaracinaceae bacterium]|nr:hypothetical protein [Sandaracinaceae bacterium]
MRAWEALVIGLIGASLGCSVWFDPARLERDAGTPADGGLADGGLADGGLADGGLADGGLADGGLADGGLADDDAGAPALDAASPDGGPRCSSSTDCDDGNPCTVGSCERGDCVQHARAEVIACDDGDACTVDDACVPREGVCTGRAVVCDDGQSCTRDECDPARGCVFTPLVPTDGPIACDDGDRCTVDDACAAGRCEGRAYECTAPAACNGAGACVCPAARPRYCPSRGCFAQCCPGEPDRPNTCGAMNQGTTHCNGDGVYICLGG